MLIPKKESSIILESTPVELISRKDSAAEFKKKHGYSLTMAKNMKRVGAKTTDEYRKIRKAWKRRKKKISQDRHALSRANRSSSSKPKFKVEKRVDMSKKRNRANAR